MLTCAHQSPHRQTGVALFVALVFLVVLTVLGVTALNNNTLQTRMAASGSLGNFAFQSAEAGVSNGEVWLESQTTQPVPSCVDPCTNTALVWQRIPSQGIGVSLANLNDPTWFGNNGRAFSGGTVYDPSSTSATKPTPPRYVIEDTGKDPSCSLRADATPCPTHYYLISGRGAVGQSDSVNTVTQSVYAKTF